MEKEKKVATKTMVDERTYTTSVKDLAEKRQERKKNRKEVSLKYDKIPKHHKVLTDEEEVERLGSGKIDLT